MADKLRRTFNLRLIRSLWAVFALYPVVPAPAANLDCPGKQEAFEVDGLWRPNADADPAKGLHILAIGSSSTEGVGASSPAFTYPAQLQARLTAMLGRPVAVDNAGVGGEKIAATVVRLKAALKTGKPDLVIWQVGTNDAVSGGDEDSFRASLLEGVAAIRAAKIAFVLVDPQFYPGVKDVARYEDYVRVIDDLGSRAGAVFPRYALMKEWGAESTSLLRAMLSKDAFHMSDRGYGCLAQNLAADLAPLLRRLPAPATDKPVAVRAIADDKSAAGATVVK